LQKINTGELKEVEKTSPKLAFRRFGKHVSEALGRDRRSTKLDERHPFDIEIVRIPPGAAACPYHSHSAQWEFYHVISGSGVVRHETGRTRIETGDAFIFKPSEPHQMVNEGTADLIYYVVADNPLGESCYYPDSEKWAVKSPEYRLIRGTSIDYYDGEE
jgi:uncharacterized cupin superfamily protein